MKEDLMDRWRGAMIRGLIRAGILVPKREPPEPPVPTVPYDAGEPKPKPRIFKDLTATVEYYYLVGGKIIAGDHPYFFIPKSPVLRAVDTAEGALPTAQAEMRPGKLFPVAKRVEGGGIHTVTVFGPPCWPRLVTRVIFTTDEIVGSETDVVEKAIREGIAILIERAYAEEPK